jgi:hypothetical protein
VVKSWEAESWDHKRREDSRGVFIEYSRRSADHIYSTESIERVIV